MFFGQAAIDYLALEATKDDPSASSHWKKYHSEFKFSGNEFSGLNGFGGRTKMTLGPRLMVLMLLQRRFRRFGDNFSIFNAIDACARTVTEAQRRAYDLDVLRQVLTIAFLHTNAPSQLHEKSSICVIGDGFASMTALLLASKSAGRVFLVNLTKTLLVDLWYLKLWMGEKNFQTSVELVTDEAGLEKALARRPSVDHCTGQVIAIQASDHELLQGCPADVVVNIASMQEMDPPVIEAYFDDMRAISCKKDLLFYCCNRKEKQLPDGAVTKFDQYPWRGDDEIIVDGLCPWHQYYYSTRPPFYRPYDGPHIHRLVKFHSTKTIAK